MSRLLPRPELQGFNVTIPYKQQIIPYLSALSDEARAIGAVNCVRLGPDGPVGYNTDAFGFRRSLLSQLGGARPERALVLGTGGASKAVGYVLGELGIPFDSVSRDSNKCRFTYGTLTADAVSDRRLIVNATPLGTYPATEGYPPIPYEGIGPGHFLFDLVYNPPLTEFLRRAPSGAPPRATATTCSSGKPSGHGKSGTEKCDDPGSSNHALFLKQIPQAADSPERIASAA